MAVTRSAGKPSASQFSRRNSGRASRPSSFHHRSDLGGDETSPAAGSHSALDFSDSELSPPPSPFLSAFRQRGSSPAARAAVEKPSTKIAPRVSAVCGSGSRNASLVASASPATKRRKLSAKQALGAPTCPAPNWTDPRISFECWKHIFCAAISGTIDDLAAGWLVHAATSCRSLAEPALTALYRCPHIKQASKAKRLATLLGRPPSETMYNYRVKVEALHINIHIVPQVALYHLIHPLSRLRELIIYTPLDQPPYRQLDKNLRWRYTYDIFRALAAEGDGKPLPTMLKTWEWSQRLFGQCVPDALAMARIHETLPFSQLTKLSLTNFQVPSLRNRQQKSHGDEGELRAYHEDGVVIESVAHAISKLPHLNHLVFESSTVLNNRLLPLLPKKLAYLELINCWEVKSDDLAGFLRTHGGDLRTLTLLHNQSLDLGFLTIMSETCPRLRELHINLSYYRHHDCVNDADPMYDQALLPSQVPTWPTSLRVVNIEHIRDWSAEAAETCLQSLIDSAGNLPHLRHLVIKSTLDIPWQARAAMRREWRARMEKVFLRPMACPEPLAGEIGEMPRKRKSSSRAPSLPSRRSGRLAVQSDSRLNEASKNLRRRCRQPLYRDPDSDEDETDQSSGETDDSKAPGEAAAGASLGSCEIQGQCETVNLQFDNQKVRELQYGMEDFLDDDEVESEDEWQGDDEDDESIVIFR